MFSHEYDLFSTKYITLIFPCKKCGNRIEEIIDSIPTPNLLAEKDMHSATLEQEFVDVECPNCHTNHTIILGSSICGGELYSEDLDENTSFVSEEIDDYFEDYTKTVESNTQFFDTFCKQMEKNKKLFANEILSGELAITLDKLLFSNIITCLETYLSDALINTIKSNQLFFKNFVKNFEEYKKQHFTLNEIYEKLEKLETIVKDDLFSLMYHNLPKIKKIYKITFDIDFPNNLGDIMRKISVRHDLVHRNGKNKDDEEIIITKDELNETYNLVFNFVKEIDDKLNAKIT